MSNEQEQKQEYFERKPNFGFQSKLSKDGKYWIFMRTETWVVPRKYIDVVAENHLKEQNNSEVQPKPDGIKKKGKRDVNSNG